MEAEFEVQLIEIYYGVPIVEVRCPKPILLTAESDAAMARAILAQPYPTMAVVIDFRNLSHAAGYGPEAEAEIHRSPPFDELRHRVVSVVRYHAASLTSLIHTMRVNMMLRHAMNSNFAPDFESAVRIARRAIDRSKVPMV